MIREVARIDEARCIGCARCLPACPFDAIVGARKYMHTVLSAACTGCELCIAPCPVDCIAMVPRDSVPYAPRAPTAQENRVRIRAHAARLAREDAERAEQLAARKQAARAWSPDDPGTPH
jgi:electron transport complex protein RnfB